MTDDPRLSAAGARWDDDAAAGSWVESRLGPFGPSVGHAVPHGYDAYAVVPVPRPTDDVPDTGPRFAGTTSLSVLMDVLRVLATRTGGQEVHCALWDGWGFLYDAGDDPRTAPGMAGLRVAETGTVEHGTVEHGAASDAMGLLRVQRPATPPLKLPHRRYHLWTGPWRSAGALAHERGCPPSFVWPEDRTWFVGAPIYTEEIAVAGTTAMVDAVLADPALRGFGARRAGVDDVLVIDD
ncbi:hypothetical protein [Xylanimonas sp. McL0601]|uniref:hypothetical protein n=1 Tax=Xylanimonas sp. McL0601 TaxID=3414739 RepID=UPI003CF0B3FB